MFMSMPGRTSFPAGRSVVRLKSGDPMIFGRAGEEMARLAAEGIGYDVVPGITAGVALAAALGVSLTHRDHTNSVRFVTGHSKSGGLPEDVDWRAIADPSATTSFYMAGRTADDLSQRSVSHGIPGDTPVVIAAARQTQQIRTAALVDLEKAAGDLDKTMPILIGVGEVFAS
jgi:uroporphyrin-III C-methyltransferase/precorrin-2 dehydrogenase/sirohydrochlorin ferrochelatase